MIFKEEFNKGKNELPSDVTPNSTDTSVTSDNTTNSKQKPQVDTILKKRLAIIACIVALLAAGALCAKPIINHFQQNTRTAALEEAIKPIMMQYGLSTYAVKYIDDRYEVYAEGLESLTVNNLLACLVKLDSVSIDDPCGDDEIDFGLAHIHPGLDVEYSYWRISSSVAALNNKLGLPLYETPGIYCDRYGIACFVACEN